jgi:hypothetical protein
VIATAATPQAVYFGWHGDRSGCRHYIQFKGTTGTEIQYDPEMLRRIFVHFLVDELPTAGLDEATESLQSMIEFYQPQAQTLLLPPRKSAKVRIHGRKQRPPMTFPTE